METNNALVTRDRLEFTEDQVKLIKELVAPNATDNELKLFLYQAKRTGLDPLTRQIYCIHRNVKVKGEYVPRMTIQVSIDGFRVVAERTGKYAGQDKPNFVYDANGGLTCVELTVYKFDDHGNRYPAAVGVAFWGEYCPDAPNNAMWMKMPHTMLSKVAEALALRKAFPQDLSGLYTAEEMAKANTEDNTTTQSFNYTLQMQSYLQNLLKTSTFDGKTFDDIASHINYVEGMTEEKFSKIKTNLNANQVDAVQAGNFNYGQLKKDWKEKLDSSEKAEEIKFEEIKKAS